MNAPNIIQTVGSPPAFTNDYVLFWSLLNIMVPIALVVLIVRYLKKQSDYRKQVVNKLDDLISLLEPKTSDDK
ncbi:MAG: hypothetical protein PHG75_06175 [Syntrophomonas sp.]|nr:hypothetical protein [Syntrophomonas sp.]